MPIKGEAATPVFITNDSVTTTIGSTGVKQAVSVANGDDVAEGSTTDIEATENGSVIAILKRVRTLVGGTGASATQNQGAAAEGAAVVGNPVLVAGKDGSGNVKTLLLDSSGNLQTAAAVAKATYAAAIVGLASVAAATDLFTITGSASKTVRITRVSISGLATSASAIAVPLIKRSAANTGGTATSPASVP